jgi:hypothetical protein
MAMPRSRDSRKNLRFNAASRNLKKSKKLDIVLIAFSVLIVLMIFVALRYQSKSFVNHNLHGQVLSSSILNYYSGEKAYLENYKREKDLKKQSNNSGILSNTSRKRELNISASEQSLSMEESIKEAKQIVPEERASEISSTETSPPQVIDKKWTDDPDMAFDTMNPAVIEASSAKTAAAAAALQDAVQIKKAPMRLHSKQN